MQAERDPLRPECPRQDRIEIGEHGLVACEHLGRLGRGEVSEDLGHGEAMTDQTLHDLVELTARFQLLSSVLPHERRELELERAARVSAPQQILMHERRE